MVRPKDVVRVAVALLVSAGALTLINPRSGEAQIGSTPVRVTNTPLPVSGNVNAAVTGDVNATISGNVHLQPGTVVNIGNSAAVPVLVHEVGAKQPARGFAGCPFSGGVCFIDIATVPAGYRLVIEQMSGQVSMFGTDRIGSIVVGRALSSCCISSNDAYLVPHGVEGTTGYYINDPTLMFFDSGDTVRIMISMWSGSGFGSANFAYAGYLIAN